jgi:hypothetical protein
VFHWSIAPRGPRLLRTAARAPRSQNTIIRTQAPVTGSRLTLTTGATSGLLWPGVGKQMGPWAVAGAILQAAATVARTLNEAVEVTAAAGRAPATAQAVANTPMGPAQVFKGERL